MPWSGHLGKVLVESVRGRLRFAILDSGSFVPICEFHPLEPLIESAPLMEPFEQPDSEHLLTCSSVPVPDVSRAPEIPSVVVTCVGPLISRIGLALSVFPSPPFCLLVLLSPEDRLFLLIHGHEISLVDSAAEFGAFHSLVRDGFVWAPPVTLPFLGNSQYQDCPSLLQW